MSGGKAGLHFSDDALLVPVRISLQKNIDIYRVNNSYSLVEVDPPWVRVKIGILTEEKSVNQRLKLCDKA